MRYAQVRSAEVVGLLGFDGDAAAALADIPLVVPSDHYGVVEDAHMILNHILVDYFASDSRRIVRGSSSQAPWAAMIR